MNKRYRGRTGLDEGFDNAFDHEEQFAGVVRYPVEALHGHGEEEEVVPAVQALDDLDIEEGDLEELNDDTDATDDPVRMYLMQMGEIPLLTRQEEIDSAKNIEATRGKYRHWMLATDFMLQGACKLLEQVRDSKLRLDRTIEVSVTNAAEKKAIMKRIVPNVNTRAICC